jgi:hypothetical protein
MNSRQIKKCERFFTLPWLKRYQKEIQKDPSTNLDYRLNPLSPMTLGTYL